MYLLNNSNRGNEVITKIMHSIKSPDPILTFLTYRLVDSQSNYNASFSGLIYYSVSLAQRNERERAANTPLFVIKPL